MAKENSAQLAALLRKFRQHRCKSQEEVARASDIAHNYYGEIERGHREPGRVTLLHIAKRGLELSPTETNLLLATAGYAPLPQALSGQEMSRLYRVVEAYLNKMLPYPALLANQFWGILKWNSSLPGLLGLPLERLPLRQRNLLRLVFDPALPCRELFPNWEEFAAYQLALFQRETPGLTHEPEYQMLWEELEKLPDFGRLWNEILPGLTDHYLGREWMLRPSIPLPVAHDIVRCRIILTRFDQVSQLFALTFFPADRISEEFFEFLSKSRYQS